MFRLSYKGEDIMRKSFLDDHYRPTGESILKESKISVGCGVISLILYGVLVAASYHLQGQAGRVLGLGGWLLILSALIGLYYAVTALQQPGGRVSVKMLGFILNAIMLCIMVFMFIQGI
jgi:hypothetical protein